MIIETSFGLRVTCQKWSLVLPTLNSNWSGWDAQAWLTKIVYHVFSYPSGSSNTFTSCFPLMKKLNSNIFVSFWMSTSNTILYCSLSLPSYSIKFIIFWCSFSPLNISTSRNSNFRFQCCSKFAMVAFIVLVIGWMIPESSTLVGIEINFFFAFSLSEWVQIQTFF